MISDHAPIVLGIELGKELFFKYWRLSVSLLNYTTVIQELKQNLKAYFEINDNGEVSLSNLWEGAKVPDCITS